MKMKTKIAVTIFPILIIAIILINLVFDLFFREFILQSEQNQVNSSVANISSYIDEKNDKYSGGVGDWGHWDDTYEFVAGDNPSYIELNMTESTFNSLDLSFIILMNQDGLVVYRQYYQSVEEEFSDFPAGFLENEGNVINFSKIAKDTSGIIKIGEAFYFVASSGITDSLQAVDARGTIIFGRQIDSKTTGDMERISGCTISSIDVLENIDQLKGRDEPHILDDRYDMNPDHATMNFELVVPNACDPESSITISMAMPRDLYLFGMNKVRSFTVHNTVGCIIVCAYIFGLLGMYITKPVTGLIDDVKSIEINKNVTNSLTERLSESGTDELSFLRKSINGLLDKIETGQKELIESREKLQATLQSVGDGVITVDTDGKIQFLNPVAQKLTGWKLDEVMNAPLSVVFNIINEYTREPVESPVTAVFKTEGVVELSNHTLLVSKDGAEVPIEDTAAPIKDSAGKIIGCVLVFRDFSERKEKQKRIEYLSFHDQLTGLYNRRFFVEELNRINVERNLPLSFVYADVNGLKMINDAFGHERGDELIGRVAEVLKTECRADDIIARIGGDEFVILLPKTTGASVEKLVRRISEIIDKISIMNVQISVSFGWDTKTDVNQSAMDVLKSAENFMYQKKILNSSSKRNGIIKSILNTLLIKSPREGSHSERVSKLCEQIGKAYQLEADEIKELCIAGELHDIGKIAVDEMILNKTSSLSTSEWAQNKHHPEIGYRLLGATAEFNNIAEYVLAHHERWDGEGYPKGLKGEEIVWKARVISVADAFDAMTCERPYRKAFSQEEAVEELKKNAGKQFDPDIVNVFIEKVLGLKM